MFTHYRNKAFRPTAVKSRYVGTSGETKRRKGNPAGPQEKKERKPKEVRKT